MMLVGILGPEFNLGISTLRPAGVVGLRVVSHSYFPCANTSA